MQREGHYLILCYSVYHTSKKIRSSAKITFLAEVLIMNSTSGYFVRWSVITKIYLPFENGPKKSRLMVSNVSEGAGCDINLCRSCDGVTDLQEVHRFNACVVILSMFEKNTLDLSSALFLSVLNALH